MATGADLRFAATAYSGLRGHTESSERFLPLHISLCIHHNDKSTARHLSPIPRGLRVQCSCLLCKQKKPPLQLKSH
ncbi:hypothetical protein DM163_23675 [Escherichia coli]|uniref:Uncharacterized protein n=1 Tax=Escherichia coli TaxID=562 RepID=A0A7H4YPT3_ECOLX|nr:hypothetical protein [Escherichia coli]EGE1109873.1 hypothetical protein [Escherichia coli]MGP92652.1 hypothetical protein [Escherichia coli]MJE63715.1 hypothetical protein [Escherichia coli]ORD03123.1 hypothetical protein A4T55_03905 [Escherichia coli]